MTRRTFKPVITLGMSLALAVSGYSLFIVAANAAAPPAPIPNGPAFTENFNDAKLGNWVTNGTFSVKDGKLILGNPRNNRENTYVYAKPVKNTEDKDYTVYSNFSVEMRARLISDPKDWGGYGIWFRTHGGGQYRNNDWNPDGGAGYVFNYIPGLNGVTLLRRPHSMAIAGADQRVKNVPIDKNWHTLRVDAVGPKITAYLDGQKMFEATHPEKPFGYTNGAVGIGVLNRGAVEVDYFRVTPR